MTRCRDAVAKGIRVMGWDRVTDGEMGGPGVILGRAAVMEVDGCRRRRDGDSET